MDTAMHTLVVLCIGQLLAMHILIRLVYYNILYELVVLVVHIMHTTTLVVVVVP